MTSTPQFVRVLYWLSFVAAVVCVMVGVIRNTAVHGPDATGMAQAPFYPGLALVTWLVAAAYGAVVVAWLRAPSSARSGTTGVRRVRLLFDGALGVVVTAIVTIALTSNDPGSPSTLVLWLRWTPVLLILLLVLVAAIGGARLGRAAPTVEHRDQEGLT